LGKFFWSLLGYLGDHLGGNLLEEGQQLELVMAFDGSHQPTSFYYLLVKRLNKWPSAWRRAYRFGKFVIWDLVWRLLDGEKQQNGENCGMKGRGGRQLLLIIAGVLGSLVCFLGFGMIIGRGLGLGIGHWLKWSKVKKKWGQLVNKMSLIN